MTTPAIDTKEIDAALDTLAKYLLTNQEGEFIQHWLTTGRNLPPEYWDMLGSDLGIIVTAKIVKIDSIPGMAFVHYPPWVFAIGMIEKRLNRE